MRKHFQQTPWGTQVALYVGPPFYAKLGEHALISAAWNSQAWGSASGGSGAHDLVHFDRHQARMRLAVTF